MCGGSRVFLQVFAATPAARIPRSLFVPHTRLESAFVTILLPAHKRLRNPFRHRRDPAHAPRRLRSSRGGSRNRRRFPRATEEKAPIRRLETPNRGSPLRLEGKIPSPSTLNHEESRAFMNRKERGDTTWITISLPGIPTGHTVHVPPYRRGCIERHPPSLPLPGSRERPVKTGPGRVQPPLPVAFIPALRSSWTCFCTWGNCGWLLQVRKGQSRHSPRGNRLHKITSPSLGRLLSQHSTPRTAFLPAPRTPCLRGPTSCGMRPRETLACGSVPHPPFFPNPPCLFPRLLARIKRIIGGGDIGAALLTPEKERRHDPLRPGTDAAGECVINGNPAPTAAQPCEHRTTIASSPVDRFPDATG